MRNRRGDGFLYACKDLNWAERLADTEAETHSLELPLRIEQSNGRYLARDAHSKHLRFQRDAHYITRFVEGLDSAVNDDHAGGAFSVADARDPNWLLSPLAPAHPLHGMFERSIRCEAGMRWRWDGVDFAVLHPDASVYGERETGKRLRKENDRSCVVKVTTAAAAALLTGDAEARSENEMLARDAQGLRSDVLLVPHHGSKTSSTEAFIDAVHPATGILSVGYRNRFRHPNAAVVSRYVERSVVLRRTDTEGALRIVLPASAGPARVQALLNDVRYWSERRGGQTP